MKKVLLACLLALTGVAAKAQTLIPEGGFETWTGTAAQRHPQGWLTTDDLFTAIGFPISIGNVTRSTASHSGSYAAQVATTSSSFLGTIPAILVLGTSLSIGSAFPGGVPYAGRPARVEFYYTLTGAGAATDSAFVQIALTRTVGGVAEIVADTSMVFTNAAASYTLASLPLQYRTGGQPDSLRMIITSGGGSNPTDGTTLTIDDVSTAGVAAATHDAKAEAAVFVYPTRSSEGRFTLSTGSRPALLNGIISVSDATGRVVLRQATPISTASSRVVELPHGTAPGIYLLRLDSPNGSISRKLLVE